MAVRLTDSPKVFLLQHRLIILAVAVLVASGVGLLQDLLHAWVNHYSFYWSESLLYKSFWLIFFPGSLILFSLPSIWRRPLFFHRLLTVLSLSVSHLAVFALLVHLISEHFHQHTFTFLRTFRYAFAEYWYICMLTYSAIVFLPFLKGKRTKQAKTHPGESAALSSILWIRKGKQRISIAVEDIWYLQTANPYVRIHTSQARHLHTITLKAMQDQLDPQQFVRIHRSTLLNLDQMAAYTSRHNGDYDVQLHDGQVLRLSRHYVSTFKAALQARS